MFRYLNKKAQSTAEYVIVLGLIIAALVAMQTYIKRGLQGRIRDVVDFTDQGGQMVATDTVQFSGEQYEPYYLTSTFDSERNSFDTEDMTAGGTYDSTANEISTREGNQTIGVVQ